MEFATDRGTRYVVRDEEWLAITEVQKNSGYPVNLQDGESYVSDTPGENLTIQRLYRSIPAAESL